MKKKNLIMSSLLIVLIIFISGWGLLDYLNISGSLYEKTINVGDKLLLHTNFDDTYEVVWESTDENVAVVDQSGLVEGVGVGVANIVATSNGSSTSVEIKVVDDEIVPIISIFGKQTVLVNETTTLNATSTKLNAKFVWYSSDQTIATVDQQGVVKGLLPGVVTIKVSLSDDPSIYKEMVLLVRTGTGIQDIINNYINENIYITGGNFDLETLNNKVVNMVKSVEESVIGVSCYSNANGTTLAGTGTGGIYKKEITDNGFKYTVFTNHHVIEDGKAIKVYLGELDEYVNAEVIKSDADMDIAILTFEHSKEYEPLKLGTMGSVNNGDFVVAIGNPGGYTYYGSVTFGMVSCNNRIMKDSDVVYVQNDTPINPGNSGGPLFNLKGEVVGINTLKLVSNDIEGMGFAIAMEEFLEYLN